MNKKDLIQIVLPAAMLLVFLVVYFFVAGGKNKRIEQRIARVTKRKTAVRKSADMLSLRKTKASGLPFVGKFFQGVSTLATLRARLERAGMEIAPDMYLGACAGIVVLVTLAGLLMRRPLGLVLLVSLLLGIWLPYFVVGMKGNKRIKKFLTLFPDAIDFIVRGLRSGLPATESMNMVGAEMEEPIGSIFAGIGESVRLGVPVEKALTDTAKKLKTTEFNFFVTSIILQRETGGNLSEILSNLSDVLRKRFMMRMKIKAMSSEAKASAIIVGALPFVVMTALAFITPGYIDPLYDDHRGNIAAAGAGLMMFMGVGIMVKMTKFEI